MKSWGRGTGVDRGVSRARFVPEGVYVLMGVLVVLVLAPWKNAWLFWLLRYVSFAKYLVIWIS